MLVYYQINLLSIYKRFIFLDAHLRIKLHLASCAVQTFRTVTKVNIHFSKIFFFLLQIISENISLTTCVIQITSKVAFISDSLKYFS